MKEQRFVIRKGHSTAPVRASLLQAQDTWGDIEVIVKQYRKRRSNEQNALVWSLYEDIIRNGGETMAGWTKEDLHELFLGLHFGTEIIELGKYKRRKPLKRSSRLNKVEFADFVDFIVRYMAELGVVLQLPGDFNG